MNSIGRSGSGPVREKSPPRVQVAATISTPHPSDESALRRLSSTQGPPPGASGSGSGSSAVGFNTSLEAPKLVRPKPVRAQSLYVGSRAELEQLQAKEQQPKDAGATSARGAASSANNGSPSGSGIASQRTSTGRVQARYRNTVRVRTLSFFLGLCSSSCVSMCS